MRQPQNNRIDLDTRADLPRASLDSDNQIDKRTPRKKRSLPLYIGIAILVAFMLIAAAASLSKQLRHQIALSIVRQPAPYTQLYFTHPGALPAKLKVGQKNTFDFTIVNDENRAYRYTYIVTLDGSRKHPAVSTATATINGGQSATRSVTIVPKDRKAKYLITVTLEGMNQSIRFYSVTS